MNLADAIRLAAQRTNSEFVEQPGQAVSGARQGTSPSAPSPAPAQSKRKKASLQFSQGNDRKQEKVAMHKDSKPSDASFAYDVLTDEPVRLPEQPSAQAQSGTAVRLELFLSPEQLNSLFRAFVSTQHTMMTLREAASYLRINQGALEHLAHEGEIPALLIDGRWRFPKANLDEWLTMQAFSSGGETNVA
jgi:excisionase family DNA binding protein